MSNDQKSNLIKIINYFEIHANPLKKMISVNENQVEILYDIYSKWAWSHFMTVIIFGMLEVAVKITPCAEYDNRGHLKKYISIKSFLETYLPETTKIDITKRYQTTDGIRLKSFEDVVKHLWNNIRSGFIHDAGIESKGMEWSTLKGIGSKGDPIVISEDVPVQELMQITWQAILNSYGYNGSLKLPKYK